MLLNPLKGEINQLFNVIKLHYKMYSLNYAWLYYNDKCNCMRLFLARDQHYPEGGNTKYYNIIRLYNYGVFKLQHMHNIHNNGFVSSCLLRRNTQQVPESLKEYSIYYYSLTTNGGSHSMYPYIIYNNMFQLIPA